MYYPAKAEVQDRYDGDQASAFIFKFEFFQYSSQIKEIRQRSVWLSLLKRLLGVVLVNEDKNLQCTFDCVVAVHVFASFSCERTFRVLEILCVCMLYLLYLVDPFLVFFFSLCSKIP